MKSHRIPALLLCGALLVSLSACGGGGAQNSPAESEPPAGTAVQVETVNANTISTENKVSGKMESDTDASVFVATAAKCTAVYVEVGDTVRAGQAICTLDLASTLSSYQAASISYDSTVKSYQDQAALFEKQIALYEKNLSDLRALQEIGAASQAEIDGAELTLLSAQVTRDSTLAQLEGAPDSFYPTMAERGLIRTAEGQVRRIRIEAEDDCGNVSTLEFAVRGRTGEFRAEADTTAVTLRPDRTSVLRVGREAEVRIPEGTIYEPIFVRPGLGEAPQADSGVVVLSPAYRFFNPATPLFRAVEVTLRARVPRPLQLHAQLAVRTHRGSLACVGGAYADGAVTASVRTSGDLAIVADTLPPAVRPLFAEGADLTRAEGVRFRAADNFSGIASWRLHIDGKWVPCDRFPMKGTLVHFFDAPAQRRTHAVRLSVTDGCGNATHFEGTFYR